MLEFHAEKIDHTYVACTSGTIVFPESGGRVYLIGRLDDATPVKTLQEELILRGHFNRELEGFGLSLTEFVRMRLKVLDGRLGKFTI